jgi:hypothetical protein
VSHSRTFLKKVFKNILKKSSTARTRIFSAISVVIFYAARRKKVFNLSAPFVFICSFSNHNKGSVSPQGHERVLETKGDDRNVDGKIFMYFAWAIESLGLVCHMLPAIVVDGTAG